MSASDGNETLSSNDLVIGAIRVEINARWDIEAEAQRFAPAERELWREQDLALLACIEGALQRGASSGEAVGAAAAFAVRALGVVHYVAFRDHPDHQELMQTMSALSGLLLSRAGVDGAVHAVKAAPSSNPNVKH